MGDDSQLIIRKTPAMADRTLDDQTIAFIEVWSAMVDWEKYRAWAIIDVGAIYFLLYSLRSEELENCYLGKYIDGQWYIETDRAITWSKIHDVLDVLKIKKTIGLGDDDAIPGDSGEKTLG